MVFFGRTTVLLLQRHFPSVKVTGRCFLLRPRPSTAGSSITSVGEHPAVTLSGYECVELTQSGDASSTPQRERAVPGSLVGNSYYTQRYRSGSRVGQRVATPTPAFSQRFFNGDVVLRLCCSAVPHELAHKRVVDVTGVQTSFLNSSEHNRRTLATVEETLATMHLHDGHEVPALQRGDVDLLRLQPQCVYAPPPSRSTPMGSNARGAAAGTEFDLTNLESVLCSLDNPAVLLAQSRRLTFRSEMEALQVARVMAASVSALKSGLRRANAVSPSGAVLQPVIRDGHLISVVLRLPRAAR